MSVVTRVRRSRRTATAAATLGVALVCGTVLLPAPAASAQTPPQASLTVQAPASVGFAGQPVEFTETIANPGTETTRYGLALDTTSELGTPGGAITIDYQDPADGVWKSFPLKYTATDEHVSHQGTLPAGLTVPAGGTTTLKLRIGAPMGRPHEGMSNGGLRSMELRSAVSALDGSGTALAQETRTIGVDSVSTSLTHVPATAVAGGAPVEFDAVLTNPTLSDYINVGNVLFTDEHATVQVRRADGSWATLPAVPTGDPGDRPGVYLEGRDSGIRTGTTTTTRVRVSFGAGTPTGTTELSPCVFVNEPAALPFRGTTMCAAGTTVRITAPTPTPTPTATATTVPTTTAPSTTAAATTVPSTPAVVPAVAPGPGTPGGASTGRLAETGSEQAPALLAGAASLLAAGAGALWLARRRRGA
ncbi:LAETG motif-containing sortase-dependent surface protein [Kitasatospora sp. NPDC087315]|uniref:LAETG motif-containing sortase-dependent surface protein n=1 Tax=Kitasatospora sp. NPDC087315 TaxID=3364069 RepID=UPI003800A4CB